MMPINGHAVHERGHDIIVVGASSGGVEALSRLVRSLPVDIPAAIFVVLHIAPDRTSALPAILNRQGRLPVVHATDGEPIVSGRVYVAPPDRHLVLLPGRIVLTSGARENRVRPAIDVLFRTAAVSYPGRTIGVVLTGQLDDGAAGMAAIKACGGMAVVQDPAEAVAPSMPLAALEAASVDHIASIDDLGALLGRLASEPAGSSAVPGEIAAEAAIAIGLEKPVRSPSGESAEPPSALSCPDCAGALREVDDHQHHFRCQVGHAFNLESLLDAHGAELERTLWMALRILEERVALLLTMARREEERGRGMSASSFRGRAEEMQSHAARLREMLLGGALAPPPVPAASLEPVD
ncbi:MAG TPA: chemotaxis protein CheB [Kofleriaceae bacterium]|nr:chemotaxis protein CheB [Kofleriaceae bacterium]